MKPRNPLSPPLAWLSVFGLLALYQFCLVPLFYFARDEVRMWLATPTPTPVAMPIDVSTEGDEATTRATFDDWLREQHALQALPDPTLEERAYYLAGETPKLRSEQTWPRWYGLRYAVGPASGAWLYYNRKRLALFDLRPGGGAEFAELPYVPLYDRQGQISPFSAEALPVVVAILQNWGAKIYVIHPYPTAQLPLTAALRRNAPCPQTKRVEWRAPGAAALPARRRTYRPATSSRWPDRSS